MSRRESKAIGRGMYQEGLSSGTCPEQFPIYLMSLTVPMNTGSFVVLSIIA